MFTVMSEKAKTNICHDVEIDSADQFKKAAWNDLSLSLATHYP